MTAKELLLKAVPPSDEFSEYCFGKITKYIKYSRKLIASDLLWGQGAFFSCFFVNFERVIHTSPIKILDQTLLSFTLYNFNDLYGLTLVTTSRT